MNMRIDQDLRSSEKDLRALKQRSSFLFFFIFLLMIIGLIKIIELTVIDRQEYFSESEKNRIINVPIYPARGLIKLSNGEIVAENIVTHELTIKQSLIDSSSTEINDLLNEISERSYSVDLDLLKSGTGSDEIILLLSLIHI